MIFFRSRLPIFFFFNNGQVRAWLEVRKNVFANFLFVFFFFILVFAFFFSLACYWLLTSSVFMDTRVLKKTFSKIFMQSLNGKEFKDKLFWCFSFAFPSFGAFLLIR